MFGIKKNSWSIREFCKELGEIVCGKTYGIQLADEVFRIFCECFQGVADCTVCYGYDDREIFFRSTLPEDEAGFYRRNFMEHTDNVRMEGEKVTPIWTKNGSLWGMWVLENHSSVDGSMESLYREIVSVVQAIFSACLFAEAWEKEQARDCVTGLYGNSVFEEMLQGSIEQKKDGYLIVAKRPVQYRKPYTADGMNCSIQMLAAVCKESGNPYVYRIGEDTVALLCLDGQEKAYAIAQGIADIGETSLYVAEFAAIEYEKVYTLIQQNLDQAEAGEAFGLQYPYPKISIYRDDLEGGRSGKKL